MLSLLAANEISVMFTWRNGYVHQTVFTSLEQVSVRIENKDFKFSYLKTTYVDKQLPFVVFLKFVSNERSTLLSMKMSE